MKKASKKGATKRAPVDTKAAVVAAAKAMIQASRAFHGATARGMFGDVGGLAGTEQVQHDLVWGVVKPEELNSLEHDVDAAIKSDEAMKKLWGAIGSFLGGLVGKLVAIAVVATMLVGCSNPTPLRVREAHAVQGQAVDALKTNHDALMKFLVANLLKSWDDTLNRYAEYELVLRTLAESGPDVQAKLKDALATAQDDDARARMDKIIAAVESGHVPPSFVKSILDEATAARERFKASVAQVEAFDQAFQVNYSIAVNLHDSIRQFLERENVTAEDAMAFVNSIKDQASKLQWTKQ